MRTFPESPPSPCEQCGAVLPGYLLICPHCGAAAPLTNAQPQAPDSPPVVAPEVSPPQRFAPLRFFKVSPARRRRTKSLPAGAPDWSLSLGAATVLIGFAVAFGTYITLTERDAMQDRSFTIGNPAEPRPTAPDVSPNAAPTRIERLTQQLQQQIAELRSRSAGSDPPPRAARSVPPAQQLAKQAPPAPKPQSPSSSSLATRPQPLPKSPSLAARPPSAPKPQSLAARPPSAPKPQSLATRPAPTPKTQSLAARPAPAPKTQSLAMSGAATSVPVSRAASASAAPRQAHASNVRQTDASCGKRGACERTVRESRKTTPTRVASVATTQAPPRRAPVNVAAKPKATASQTVAVRPPLPSAIETEPLSSTDDRPLYRQH